MMKTEKRRDGSLKGNKNNNQKKKEQEEEEEEEEEHLKKGVLAWKDPNPLKLQESGLFGLKKGKKATTPERKG